MKHPLVLYEEPVFKLEGMEWVRGDLTPPLRYMHLNGQDYTQPWNASVQTIEPVTTPEGTVAEFPITTAANDQHIYKGGTYPPTSLGRDSEVQGTLTVGRYISGPFYYVYNGLLAFDTSSLPTSIGDPVLRIYVTALGNVDSLDLTCGVYAWDGTSILDYSHSPEMGAFAVPLASLTASSVNSIPLPSGAISTTGETRLRLHVSQKVGDAPPSGLNYIQFAAFENTSLPEPRLIVPYT